MTRLTSANAVARASVGLGWRLFHRENPIRLLVFSVYLAEVCTGLFYVLLGAYVSGAPRTDFYLVGAAVLGMTFMAVGATTDIPLTDKWQGTYWRLSRSGRSPYGLFLARTVPTIVHAVASSIVTVYVVGAATGHLDTALRMLSALPLLVVLAVLTTFVGLAVVAPAIGTRYDVLTYNLVLTVITVFSGALVPPGSSPVVDTVGQVVPLRHGLAAVRGLLDGKPWLGELGHEAALAAVWVVLGSLLYRWMDARGRRTGVAAFG
jgi:ABC-2 type transport system permease protein